MKFPLACINDYVDLENITNEKISKALTMSGTKVEKIEKNKETNEYVLEIELTSNRPDCLSVFGISREFAAVFDRKFKIPDLEFVQISGEIENEISVEITNFDLCSIFSAKVIKNVSIKESPEWLQNRLKCFGIKPINNVVDITNYVMLEYGQPMHAYDLNNISNKKIIVRLANKGEILKTLDKVERKLDETMIVISDDKKAIGLAGIMGGFNTIVTNSTKTILLEAANFSAEKIKNTSKKLGIKTNASSFFEKNILQENVFFAINRACQLISNIGCGNVLEGTITKKIDSVFKEKIINLEADQINKILGSNIQKKDMIDILSKLGFKVENDKITVPWFRNDIENFFDVAEEISRIYGYEKIPSTPINSEINMYGKTIKHEIEDKIKNILVHQGYFEIITSSFSNNKLNTFVSSKAVEISNPTGDESKSMRTSLIDSMINVILKNINCNNDEVRLFEMGNIYRLNETAQDQNEYKVNMNKKNILPKLPVQNLFLSIGMCKNCDFYDLKGTIQELFENLGIFNYSFEKLKDNKLLHSGKAASVLINGVCAGFIGQYHPHKIKNFSATYEIYLCELSFEEILKNFNSNRKYSPVSKFPSIVRDISFFVKNEIDISEIENFFTKKKLENDTIEKIKLIDIYFGNQVTPNTKSVTYSIIFRSSERTLTEFEINIFFEKMTKELFKEFNACFR
ncbi:MAG: phenylalanine--tRNA ligase subunit beta [Clostridiales bacterium]|jgi:phenylalanyl-tRNA synthetase beta chain|nr:phenylalanine--tRNA ligase subunit beta [Clostridiales bacterium]